jgi:hypothetical protein
VKYLTYIENVQGLNIFEQLGDSSVSRDSLAHRLQCSHGVVCISAVSDSYDFSSVTTQARSLFSIQEHDLESLKIFVYSNSSQKILISSSDGGAIYIIDKGEFDDLTDHINSSHRPYESWVWDDIFKHWKPPIEKPEMPSFFEVKWNFSTNEWDVQLRDECLERRRREYRIWKPVPKESGHFFSDACSTTNFMTKSLEEVTHSTNELVERAQNIWAQLQALQKENQAVARYDVVLDLSPIAMVMYHEVDSLLADGGIADHWQMHPQCAGRTIHELFRLIIEWAWAYTELGNTEPTAEICHQILQATQMPMSVREELLALEPEAVGKYVLNDPTALEDGLEDPEQPPLFKSWLSEQYKTFKKRQSSDPIRVKYPLYDYDR